MISLTSTTPAWRRIGLAVALVAGSLAAVSSSLAEPASAACAGGSRVIGGSFTGSDGRSVSGFVGLAVFDASGQSIGADGCPTPAGGYGSFIDSVNPSPANPACCFALPTSGDPNNGGERTWRIAVPDNAATVWVEAYPKSSSVSDYNGLQHQTDYRRYGGAMRRGVPASGTGINVSLPLSCSNGNGGNTGTITGTVTRNGQAVSLYSVVAFSRAPEGGPTLGFVATPYLAPGAFTLPSLAPNQSYALEFRTTDGGHYWFEHDYGYGVPVSPCGTVNRSFQLLANGRAVSSGDVASGPTPATNGGTWSAYYRGGDGALWQRIDAPGQSPQSLGGTIVGEPDATSWGTGRTDVVARGGDGQVWWRYYSNGWSPWLNLGGGTSYSPTVTSWAPGRLDVIITGLDGQLWHRWTANGGATWSGWSALGGRLTSAPDVTSWGPNRLDIVARGQEGAVWHLAWGNAWFPWEYLGGRIAGGPANASAAVNRLDVVVWGGGNQVYVLRWNGGGWTGWAPLNGGLTDAEPDISSSGGTTRVYVRGGDGNLWRASRSGADGGYGGWAPAGA